jgi:hypothetical protein
MEFSQFFNLLWATIFYTLSNNSNFDSKIVISSQKISVHFLSRLKFELWKISVSCKRLISNCLQSILTLVQLHSQLWQAIKFSQCWKTLSVNLTNNQLLNQLWQAINYSVNLLRSWYQLISQDYSVNFQLHWTLNKLLIVKTHCPSDSQFCDMVSGSLG